MMIEIILPVSIALIPCFMHTAIKHDGFLRWLSFATIIVVDITLYYFLMEAKNATVE